MPTDRQLLTIAIVAEAPTAGLLLFIPDVALRILFGAWPASDGHMAGRVAGVMLLALVIACWGARKDAGGPARAATLVSITLYNAAVGVLFVLFAVTGQADGLLIWPAGLIHLILGVAFFASLRRGHDRIGAEHSHG
jgi:hypothetical protein